MSYKITIEKVDTVWKKSRSWNRKNDDSKDPNQYGYVDAELPVIERTTMLEQTLEELDLAAVIKAANKL